jgi:heterotetrameric sarcosine oxidase delta subunit
MSFLLPCPNCGPRDVNEFHFQGEVTTRPREPQSFRELTTYLYFRKNVAGVQREWWYHRFGCETWFLAERDTRTNEVLSTELPQPATREGAPGMRGGAQAPAPSVPEPPTV